MNFVEEDIAAYCEAHTKPESIILKDLERETHLKTLAPQMLSGHLQGKFLRFISNMIQPAAILEIGTFTGYSAICLAEGLKEGGVLHTIEIGEELKEIIMKYIEKAGLSDKIKLHIGDAHDIIPGLQQEFDLIFIDADKVSYPAYYDLVFDRVKNGGYIVADNALWSGKVLENKRDKDTQGIHLFNEKVNEDKRVDNMLIPIRDGIMLIRKL